MPQNRIHILKSRLDSLYRIADGIRDEEIKSHFARYLCVLTSGYIEESMKILLEEYAHKHANPKMKSYLIHSMKNVTNLKLSKIEQQLSLFDPKWAHLLIENLSDKERDAINSIVANRNDIAHGRNVTISFVRIKEWYVSVVGIIEKINIIIELY